jgi:hypothetical protein
VEVFQPDKSPPPPPQRTLFSIRVGVAADLKVMAAAAQRALARCAATSTAVPTVSRGRAVTAKGAFKIAGL